MGFLGAVGGYAAGGSIGGTAGALGAFDNLFGYSGGSAPGGSANQYRSFKDAYGTTDQEIDAFGSSSYGQARNVNSDFLRYTTATFGADNQIVGYSSVFGNDRTSETVKAFLAWKKAQSASSDEHAAYVDLVTKNPGRQATILKPMESGTVSAAPGDFNLGSGGAGTQKKVSLL